MKKTYINPEMLVVKIASQQLLAGSTLGLSDIDKNPVTEADARLLDDEFFDEEQEEIENDIYEL